VEQYEQGGSVNDWNSPGRAMSFRWAEVSSAVSREAADTTKASASARKIFISFILKTAVQTAKYTPNTRKERELSGQTRFPVG